MNRNPQNEFQCSQFEAALADALDDADADADADAGSDAGAGVDIGAGRTGMPARLVPELRRAFDAHRGSCPACDALYAEALEGMRMLRSIEEVEPPRHLMHNILAATSRAEAPSRASEHSKAQAGWLDRLVQGFRPRFSAMLHSRFVASFCMAFFSLSLTLSLSGVRFSDVARIDWRPNALRKSVVLEYTQIEARVMRYYDNMRLVYEVQSKVQRLKQAASPAQNQDGSQPQQQNRKQAPGEGRPEPEENYSQHRDGSLAAQLIKNEGVQL